MRGVAVVPIIQMGKPRSADSAMCPRLPILKVAAAELEPSSAPLEACRPTPCNVPVSVGRPSPHFPGQEAEAQRASTGLEATEPSTGRVHRMASRALRLTLHCPTPSALGCHQGRSGWSWVEQGAACLWPRARTGGMGPSRWHKVTFLLPCSLRLGDQMR